MNKNIEELKEKAERFFDYEIAPRLHGDIATVTNLKSVFLVLFSETPQPSTAKEDKSMEEIKKEFDRRMTCGTSEGGFWNDVESLNKQRIWNFFEPHLNSRNLLERFVRFLSTKGFIEKGEVLVHALSWIDEFIESEKNR